MRSGISPLKPEHRGAAASVRTRSRWEGVVFGLIALAIGWFYLASARTEDTPWNFGQRQGDYYNLLVDGMLDGHLSLKVDVPPQLLALSDPYNPANRPPGMGLHDASLYHGRYYLYFGIAPVVTLLLPFRILTHTALPLPAAVVIFAYAGFLASATTWWLARRRYFPRASLLLSALVLVALGTVSMAPALVRRANIWELPLSGGYFFSAVAVLCVFQTLHVRMRATAWLAGASLGLGLAVASRPTYLYGIGLLVLPLGWMLFVRRVRGRALVRVALAAVVPLGAVGLAMAAYNYARFGNPLEFGVAYQFSGIYEAKARHFSWSYLPYNLGLYGFAPFSWSIYFPYIHQAQLPAPPAGHFGIEEVCGVLKHMLFVWFAIAAPAATFRRDASERARLVAWLLAVAALGVGTMTTLGFFYAVIGRYEADFMPSFVLLAAIGVLALERQLMDRGSRGVVAARAAMGLIVATSAAFAVLFSLVIYGNFQRSNPRAYAHLARIGDYPAYWVEKLAGRESGALDMTLRFPAAKSGREPLVQAGWYKSADHVYVEYEAGSRIRLGYSHDLGGAIVSRWITIDSALDHRLRVQLGSLFPPEEDPFYDGWSEAMRTRVTRRVHVELDGEVLLDAYRRYESTTPDRVLVGRDASEFGGAFSGKLNGIARTAAFTDIAADRVERLAVQFAFSADAAAEAQPLLTLRAANGPVVWYVRRGPADLTFGYAANGERGESAPVSADPERVHELELNVRLPAAGAAPTSWLTLDGTPVWTVHDATASRWGSAVIGRSATDVTACASRFSGRIAGIAIPEDTGIGAGAVFDRMTMSVALPHDPPIGTHEPVVTTGVTGGADFLYIDYVDAQHVRFGLEHWGKPGIFSPPIRWRAGDVRHVGVSLGSFPALDGLAPVSQGRVEITIDGVPVWSTPARFYRADPSDIFVGRNPVGGTACGARFSGTITEVTRLAR